jgi:lipopolysaccharide/colanic/teichoic acid biosynthesis glycosyltransferase
MRGLSGRVVKRTVDIIVSACVLVVAAPIMLAVAIAIIVESPGPLFYRARRVGYRGRPLAMLKFRKMQPQARGAALTVANDARLTRVGAFMTKTRVDELPQFWHVLRGEMSLIGPRPEDPVFVARRAEDYEEILQVRPGLTGLSQLAFAEERGILPQDDPVSYYVDRLLPQKCGIDRLYARQASLATDLRIVAWTLIALVLRRPVAVHRGTGRLSVRRRPAVRPVRRDEPATSVATRS